MATILQCHRHIFRMNQVQCLDCVFCTHHLYALFGWHESLSVLQTASTFTPREKHDVSRSLPSASKGRYADKLIATITHQQSMHSYCHYLQVKIKESLLCDIEPELDKSSRNIQIGAHTYTRSFSLGPK